MNRHEFSKPGKHPLIVDYNKSREECIAMLDAKLAQITSAEKDASKPVARYGNVDIDVRLETDFMTKETVIEVTALAELLNKAERDEYLRTWGSVSGFWEETKHGSYRVNEEGIMTSRSGNTDILKSPTVLSVKELTDMIIDRVVPARLLGK